MQPLTYIYARASTDKQVRSTPEQVRRCIEYHALIGTLPPLRMNGAGQPAPFIDNAKSGSIPFLSRPASHALMTEIPPLSHVIFDSYDRIGRDQLDSLGTIRLLNKRRIVFHILNMLFLSRLDPEDPMTEVIIGQFASFAQTERKMTSFRNKKSAAARKAIGVAYCNGRPVGYKRVENPDFDPQKRIESPRTYKVPRHLLVPDPDDQRYFDRALALYLSGEKITKIQRHLKDYVAAPNWPYHRLYEHLMKELHRREEEAFRIERARTFQGSTA